MHQTHTLIVDADADALQSKPLVVGANNLHFLLQVIEVNHEKLFMLA